MREIKFRAWDWVEKQMCPVTVADFQDTQAKLFCRFPKSGTQGIFSADLMQYIGAKDKNGIEIYEGMSLRCVGKDSGDHRSVCHKGTEDCRGGTHPDAQL